MNGIQVINNLQHDGIVQMIWSGTVSLSGIRNSLTELNRVLYTRTSRVNIVITVDPSTQLTSTLNPHDLPQVTAMTCRGWMIIGGNGIINQTINQMMHFAIPNNHQTIR